MEINRTYARLIKTVIVPQLLVTQTTPEVQKLKFREELTVEPEPCWKRCMAHVAERQQESSSQNEIPCTKGSIKSRSTRKYFKQFDWSETLHWEQYLGLTMRFLISLTWWRLSPSGFCDWTMGAHHHWETNKVTSSRQRPGGCWEKTT